MVWVVAALAHEPVVELERQELSLVLHHRVGAALDMEPVPTAGALHRRLVLHVRAAVAVLVLRVARAPPVSKHTVCETNTRDR